jgi:hypothetical protein
MTCPAGPTVDRERIDATHTYRQKKNLLDENRVYDAETVLHLPAMMNDVTGFCCLSASRDKRTDHSSIWQINVRRKGKFYIESEVLYNFIVLYFSLVIFI